MTDPLQQANIDWHNHLDALFSEFLCHLTALKLDETEAVWERYKTSLLVHIRWEDQFIAPLSNDLKGNQKTLIAADHKILERLVKRIDDGLRALRQADAPRLLMVEQLDGYIKMRNVLKHHDMREVLEFYPALNADLPTNTIKQMGQKMTDLFEKQP